MFNKEKKEIQMRTKRFVIGTLLVVMVLAIGVNSVFAGIGKDIPDKGKHYNLNIIGVQYDKTADMNDTHGHTIFVPLNKDGSVSRTVTINVIRNETEPGKFQVLDRNATDGNGALIAVPFENMGTLSFNVYATALGKPGREVYFEAETKFKDTCINCELLVGNFTIKRDKGNKGKQKPVVVDISDIFRASGCIDLDPGVNPGCTAGDIEFDDVWVFNIPELETYNWQYTNKGLKLMQVRFYPTTSGSYTTKE